MLTVLRRPGASSVREVIDPRAAGQLIRDDRPGDVVWLDADRPDQAETELVARLAGVGLDTLRRVLASDRPVVHVDRGALVASVATAAAAGEQLRVVRTAVVVAPTAVVTCHPDRYRLDVERCAAAAARLTADDATSPTGAFAVLLDELIGDQWTLGDDIDDRLADAVGDPPPTPDHIAALRRDLLTLHRVIGPVRRQLADLVEAAANAGDDGTGRLEQLHSAVVALRAQVDTQLLLLNSLSQTQLLAASQHANAVMQATSSWGAILVVATLITGVYGMNFRAMPELTWPWGYPFAIGLIATSTLLLYRLFRGRGWL